MTKYKKLKKIMLNQRDINQKINPQKDKSLYIDPLFRRKFHKKEDHVRDVFGICCIQVYNSRRDRSSTSYFVCSTVSV